LRQNIHNFGENVAMTKKLKKTGSSVVKEPAVLYKTNSRRESYIALAPVKHVKSPSKKESHTITRWLGGAQLVSSSIKSDFDIINAGSEGISKSSVDALANYLGISRKSMAEDIFDLSVKTLERKAPADKMDKRTSSHALEIAKVMQHAFEVFEDEEKLKHWVNKENKALNGTKPVLLFSTLTGLNMVNDVLGRIEEGIYS
jgi:putative toxin-antitoxin system antitoxin component (TIGR02293 family)